MFSEFTCIKNFCSWKFLPLPLPPPFSTAPQSPRCWLVYNPAPTHFQPGKIMKMADVYSKQLRSLQQKMIVLLTTSLQLSTRLLTLCMHRQNTLKNIIYTYKSIKSKSIKVIYIKVFWFPKEVVLKKQLFSRQQRKTRKRRQY